MSKTTRSGPGPEQAWPFDYSHMLSNGDVGVKAVMEANRAFLDGMAAMSEEIGRFVGNRLQEDMGASQSLMACKTPEQAMSVQLAFAQTATQQYFEEAGRLMALAMDIARKNCRPLDVAGTGEAERSKTSD